MMKNFLLIATFVCFLFCLCLVGKTQTSKKLPFSYIFEFATDESDSIHTSSVGFSDLCGVDTLFSTKHYNPITPIILGVGYGSYPPGYGGKSIEVFTKTYLSYNIPDTTSATLIALGITPKNINDYKYRVVENDSNEKIPWSPIPSIEQKYGAKKPYGFIGTFNRPGQLLMVEVVNRKNYYIRDGVILNWNSQEKPIIKSLSVLKRSNSHFIGGHPVKGVVYQCDNTTGLPLNLKFPKNSDLIIEMRFKRIPFMDYSCDILNKTITGKDSIEGSSILINKDGQVACMLPYKPGKYELIVKNRRFYYNDKNVLRIPFEIYTTKEKEKEELKIKILRLGTLLAILLGILFLIYYLYSKRKLKRTIQQKEKTSLQLKAIRSQLNPHFTFNALNSIQNLMNQNNTEAANHYLSKFASLTRRVLTTSDNDLISLSDEITLLDDYLQMEQLRFGFKYTINTDANLNKANIEIPSMLLQPFVENAVKHGVSTLRDKGLVEINIHSDDKNLVLLVIDNGPGFKNKELNLNNASMGLKLSRERIALLNSIYKNQHITMEISTPTITGTMVTVTLGDWL